MKRTVCTMIAVLMVLLLMTSCVTNTHIVGDGPDGWRSESRRQLYLLGGLMPIGTASSHDMAGNDQDYRIVTKYTLMDFVISAITGGLLMSRTVIVTK